MLTLENIIYNGLSNFWNKYFNNNTLVWNHVYRRDYSLKLESTQQLPRNQVVADLVWGKMLETSYSPQILDVGCGVGTLYRLLQGLAFEYEGIDLSESAIEQCRRTFETSPKARFEVARFEDFQPQTLYDVIVLNEVLYYFPLTQIRPVVKTALSLLKGNGRLIISMSVNPKAYLIWWMIRKLGRPQTTVPVQSESGHRWLVKSLTGI